MARELLRKWECPVCGFIYDEAAEGIPFEELPDDWECPICGAAKSEFQPESSASEQPSAEQEPVSAYLRQWARPSDEIESYMADIHRMAETGQSIIEPMRARRVVFSWDDILIKGAQLARFPLNPEEPVDLRTVIGPKADKPLVIETPVYITHMSFGALSREAQVSLAKGSAAVRTAMGSGEGGILAEARGNAYRYIFEYVPNRYSLSDENLRSADAVEIKIGQSAKPGMGGHLPGEKVTADIAAIRGFPEGTDIHSPARFPDIRTPDDLKERVAWLRERSGGRPIGIKLAAGRIEADLEVALYAEPDFITIDGRPGGTGAAPKFVKLATSIPTIFALRRARKFLDARGAEGVSLVVTGGLRVSSDFAKALAMGADAVAVGTAAMMACGCQQYRICNTGLCPVGVATQNPELRDRLDTEQSARRIANYLRVSTEELAAFARLTGCGDIHSLSLSDLCTVNSEISVHTDIEHV
ncbi:MAG: rubredoxin [Armatimonadetes bacterium]|nr:rubredoxin [Armatimonadota bacterium]